MIPRVNNRGHSFKGVMAYLMHDKQAQTDERVLWHETGNMATHDPNKAAMVMAWTDVNAELLKAEAKGSTAGAKTEAGAVYHYSLSWAHGEAPDVDHQKEQAIATLGRLGLQDHQYVMVAHDDTDHAHVHVVANLTHHETGKRHTPSLDKRELQSWALEYEQEHGVHCDQRDLNAQSREQGIPTKYRDQKQDYSVAVTRAYHAADNGQSFTHALEAEGLHLASARRGSSYVLVDSKGDIQKLARQLDLDEKGKAKTAVINVKLADLDRGSLPDADQLARDIISIKQRAVKNPEYVEKDDPEAPQEVEDKEEEHATNSIEENTQKAIDETPLSQEMQERIAAYEGQLPTEPPQDLPQSVPQERPQPLEVKDDPSLSAHENRLSHYIATAQNWMKDKMSSVYHYLSRQKQRDKQRETIQHEKDKER